LLATIWKYDDLGAFDLRKVHITIIAGDSEEFKNWLGEYEAKCYRAVSMDGMEQSGERVSLAPAETQTPELVARAYKPGS